MKLKNFLFIALLMLFTVPIFAATQDTSVNPGNIVEWLTPFIVIGATALIRYAKPLIPGWATMLIISGLSAAVAWVTSITIGGDMSFLMQTLYGLLAVFIHQISRQFQGGNSTFARTK